MSSGGGKTSTTTQTNDPPAWATPYFKEGLDKAKAITDQPYTPYTGERVAGFTDDQMSAMDGVRMRAEKGSDTMRGAQGYLQSTLSGGPNPYTDKMVDQVTGDISSHYRDAIAPSRLSQFNSSGAYGGSAMQQAQGEDERQLVKGLGDASTSIRAGAYEADQARKMQAAGMAPGMAAADYADYDRLAQQGAQQQSVYQSLLDSQYGDFTEQRDWKKNQLGSLAQMLSGVQGGSMQATGANPNYRSGGQNAAGYAAIIASLFG